MPIHPRPWTALRNVAALSLCCFAGLFFTGCSGHSRNKGDVSIFAVDPIFRPESASRFEQADFDTTALSTLLKAELGKSENERRFTDGAILTALGLTADQPAAKFKEALDDRAALIFNELLFITDLRKKLDKHVPTDLPGRVQALMGNAHFSDRELLEVNRALLIALYHPALLNCHEPKFAGGFLKGAFGVCTDTTYAEKNGIRPNQGYRLSFDKVHVRYCDEVGGAEFLVYVELYRGSNMEPFYTQVICHETEMPRNTDVIRKTVMTPAFTYEKDEPILFRIVGIELDSAEEIKIGNQLKSLTDVAEKVAGFVPQAQIVPAVTQLAATLFELAKDGDDIEFQYTVSFYPPDSSQIEARKKPHNKKFQKLFVELPLVATQFVLIKDENVQRRVVFESAWDYFYLPFTRIVPCVLWAAALPITEPYFALFESGHLKDRWRFPGLFDEPVDRASYEPVHGFASRLGVYNDQLRKADKDGELLVALEDRPHIPYKDKTHVIFSILRTDEGTRDPSEALLKQHSKFLSEALGKTGSDTSDSATRSLEQLVTGATDYIKLRKTIQKTKGSPLGNDLRIKNLLEDLRQTQGESYTNVVLEHLNALTGGSRTKEEYLRILNEWGTKTQFKYDQASKSWEYAGDK